MTTTTTTAPSLCEAIERHAAGCDCYFTAAAAAAAQAATTAAAEGLLAADWIKTSALAHYALTWHAFTGNPAGVTYVWELISSCPADADAFYATITDPTELRELAAEALAGAGWDRRKIGHRLS